MGRWREALERLIQKWMPLLPIHGEVARSAGGADSNGSHSSPFMGRWREAPEGLIQKWMPRINKAIVAASTEISSSAAFSLWPSLGAVSGNRWYAPVITS